MKNEEKEKITPEKAKEILQQEGVELTTEQAKDVLEFMRKLANIAITKYLDKWQR